MAKKKQKTWNGYPMFECLEDGCRFDSLHENALKEHHLNVHTPPLEPSAGNIVVVDRFENPIREE